MRAVAILVLLLLAPSAAAAPEQFLRGIPTGGASGWSVQWVELDPLASPADWSFEGPTSGPASSEGPLEIEGPSLGRVWQIRGEGLAPASTYRYTVGETSYEFTTPPAEVSADRPLRVVALGDMGISERAAETVRVIEELDPDLILHLGDISYAEGRQNEWIDWFRMVEPVAARIPWVTALGNHETYTVASPWGLVAPPSPLEIQFYQQRFSLPENEIWYSFDWAGVHFVALDTFSQDGGIAQEQVAWLEEDLAASDAKWKIAFLHEPPYSSNDHGSSERVQDAFVPLLEEHGVQLMLAGHDHGYERTRPMNGVTYVVSGGGGESLYSTWEEPAPEWSVKRGAEYHVTLLEIWPDRIEGRVVVTQGGELSDEFTIVTADVGGGAPAAIVTNETPLAPIVTLASVAIAFAFARRR